MTTQTPSAPVYTGIRGAKSETTAGLFYIISADADGRARCTCPDFAYRGHIRDCKHLKALAAAPVVAAPVECESCSLYGEDAACRWCAGSGVIQAVR